MRTNYTELRDDIIIDIEMFKEAEQKELFDATGKRYTGTGLSHRQAEKMNAIINNTYELLTKKSGMYWELPHIELGGGYSLFEMANPANEKIWVQIEDGEGAEMKKELLLPYIKSWFRRYF